MNTSETTSSITPALAAAQASLTAIPRSRTATVKTRSGGSYQYSYASLDQILPAVREPLMANGLTLTQATDCGEGGTVLVTRIFHKSGEWIEGRLPLRVADPSDPQAVGSAITYMRRYAICALLCIATEDDDGQAGSEKPVAQQPTKQQPAKEAAKTPSGGGGVATVATQEPHPKLTEWMKWVRGIREASDLLKALETISQRLPGEPVLYGQVLTSFGADLITRRDSSRIEPAELDVLSQRLKALLKDFEAKHPEIARKLKNA